jgi:electron transfer flavoprotein alpha subunit
LAERPLVFLELVAGRPTPGSLGVLGRARAVYGEAAALVCGPGAGNIGAGLGSFGADVVFTCAEDSPEGNTASMAPGLAPIDAIAHLVEDHGVRTVLFEASSVASDLAGALSARLDAGVNWGLNDMFLSGDELVGVRTSNSDSLRAGGGRVSVGWVGERRLASFETDAFAPRHFPGVASIVPLVQGAGPHRSAVRRRGAWVVAGDDDASRTLGTADVIVAGGRGMRDPSVLRTLEELAELLGGAVGVSMPIVDRGWYPYEHQVGSATPSVRPRIYIACGISGSVQHRLGMQHSAFVVAINVDRDAPIMGFADVGVVADLHELLPQLVALARGKRVGGSAESQAPDPAPM